MQRRPPLFTGPRLLADTSDSTGRKRGPGDLPSTLTEPGPAVLPMGAATGTDRTAGAGPGCPGPCEGRVVAPAGPESWCHPEADEGGRGRAGQWGEYSLPSVSRPEKQRCQGTTQGVGELPCSASCHQGHTWPSPTGQEAAGAGGGSTGGGGEGSGSRPWGTGRAQTLSVWGSLGPAPRKGGAGGGGAGLRHQSLGPGPGVRGP